MKLTIGFGSCVALLIVVCILSFLGMSRMSASSDEITNSSGPLEGVQLVAKMRRSALLAHQRNSRILSLGKSDYEKGLADAAGFDAEFKDTAAKYEKQATGEDRQNLEKVVQLAAEYNKSLDEVHKDILNGKMDRAKNQFYNGVTDQKFTSLLGSTDKLMSFNVKDGDDLSKASAAEFHSSVKVLTIIGIVAALFAALFGVLITRQITGAVREISQKLDRVESNCLSDLGEGLTAIAEGDLTRSVVATTEPIVVSSKDEFGKLAQTFNGLLSKTQQAIVDYGRCRENLADLLGKVKGASFQVSNASNGLSATANEVGAAAEEVGASMQQISLATQQAARGASEVATGSASQAKSLSESSRGVDELVDSIQNVAREAEEASKAASTAGDAATRGSAVVEQSMRGMKALSESVRASAQVIHVLGESSQKIGAIVQTINEIAEQTNLLALNAAIEAARAGDAGRGFAVVADEVRKLAERSRVATQEIGSLIGEIQTQTGEAVSAMEAGTQEVESQGEVARLTQATFAEIETAFNSVLSGIGDIRAASQQMASASKEVSRSISEVVAVVEESSAAAEELSASSEEVSASVDTVASAANQQSASAQNLVTSSLELQDLSRTLSDAVAQFKMEEGGVPIVRLAA